MKIDNKKIWQDWKIHFQRKATRPIPNEWKEEAIPASVKKELIPTISILLQGETGEGRIVNQMRKSKFCPSKDYIEALDLFVKEEGRHARLLTMVLRSIDCEIPEKHFSGYLFTKLRDIIGPLLKIILLFSAEAMAVLFYNCLSEKLYGTPMGKILMEIAEDEKDHLKFHTDFFKYSFSKLKNFLLFTIFQIETLASLFVLCVDHSRIMQILKIEKLELFRKLRKIHKLIYKEIVFKSSTTEF